MIIHVLILVALSIFFINIFNWKTLKHNLGSIRPWNETSFCMLSLSVTLFGHFGFYILSSFTYVSRVQLWFIFSWDQANKILMIHFTNIIWYKFCFAGTFIVETFDTVVNLFELLNRMRYINHYKSLCINTDISN